MNDEFDVFLQELQEHIFEETRREFGEKVCERWQNPRYLGVMHNADGHAKVKGTCGDSMEIFLEFDNNRVVSASFQTDGCGPSVVCGSYAAEMALGKTPDELFGIIGTSILKEIDGLPKDHEHCAFLAAKTLQVAADDYMVKQARKPEEEAGEGM